MNPSMIPIPSEDKALISQKDIFRTKRSYVPVELDKRQKLVKAVEEEGLTIKEAALNLKINYSTAKHIVKVFKKTGEVSTQQNIKRKPDHELGRLELSTMQQVQE
jgi:transposase